MKAFDLEPLILPDGRCIVIAIDPVTDAVSLGTGGHGFPLLVASPADMGMIAAGLERAAVLAGQQAAKRRDRASRESPRLAIEEIAGDVERRAARR
ncbi:MAG: hypothetical protein V4479_07455 [Actinomycetota bacterium]